MVNIVLISGKAGVGKDTLATELKNVLKDKNYSVKIMHFADLVKYTCKTFFDWDGVKDDNGRHLLQYIGTDVARNYREDFWVNYIKDMILMTKGRWDYILIPDTRFPNEIECFLDLKKEEFNMVAVRVEREFDSSLTEENASHSSETSLDDWPFDIQVEIPNGVENVKICAQTLVLEGLL